MKTLSIQQMTIVITAGIVLILWMAIGAGIRNERDKQEVLKKEIRQEKEKDAITAEIIHSIEHYDEEEYRILLERVNAEERRISKGNLL